MQAGMFNIGDVDCGFSINGANYNFDHVDKVAIEDPKKTHLIRGANSTSKTGLYIKEGSTSPYIWTVDLKGMSPEFFTLLKSTYESNARLDCWLVDRETGSSKTLKNSVLQMAPRQLTVSEGEDNLTVQVVVEGYDLIEQYKDAPEAAPAE